MEINKKVGLRGSGPAPQGYVKCYDGQKCSFSRDFSTGRFTKLGHYHPVIKKEVKQ